ncbi:MAG TPA: DUF429 domain-containing protein [Chroococcales cyanobacterium]
MTDRLIAGVDFSGAKEAPNNTWLCMGNLGSLGLEILEISKVGSHKIARELSDKNGLEVAGFDFPFSLPDEFLRFVAEKLSAEPFQEWQQVAERLIFMPFEEFLALAVEFKKEPKRIADKATSRPAQSPLHRGNPSMVQMTYQGIRMLASLDPARFAVLPFQNLVAGKCAVLEVYPRESLHALGLPDSGYKSKEKKEQDKVTAARRDIIKNLIEIRERKGITHKDCLRLNLSPKVQHIAVESDHALDALIACYTAALWASVPAYFRDPFSMDDVEILLEGWIYSPTLPSS